MFRQSLQRCAGRAATALVAPRLAPVLRRSIPVSVIRPAVANRISLLASRSYSTESPAPEATEVQDEHASPESTGTFAGLQDVGVHPNLLRAITEGMGYSHMTPVQDKTIGPALKGSDIVAQAKTGTGKTLAFLLPLLQRMIVEDPKLAFRSAVGTARATDIRGIILSPTRELAEQIAAEARKLCRYTGLVVQTAVGGTRKSEMLRQVQRHGCHLLVGTPGRLNDILSDPSSGVDAPNLAAMVLDEADRMLDVGFEAELMDIMGQLPDPAVRSRQTMLVSATIPDNVIRLARNMVRADDFQFVQTIGADESLTHDHVKQHVVATTGWSTMFQTLFELIDREEKRAASNPDVRPFKAIVYFNTTSMVQLASVLAQERRRSGTLKNPCVGINSKLTQSQRERAAKLFKGLKSGILFSSDVTARGMDFPNVTHVIQVDVPSDRETYIHRLGRTARQNKEGEGWMLLPSASMGQAKRLLRGLPLEPDTSLQNAKADIQEGSTPQAQELRDLGRYLHHDVVTTAYSSVFGGFKGDKAALVDDLNDWAVHGLGLSAPPSFSKMWAQKLGLTGTNLSISDRRFTSPSTSGSSRDGAFESAFAGQVRDDSSRGRGRDGRDGRDGRGFSDRRGFGGGRRFGGDRGDRGGRGDRGDRSDRGFDSGRRFGGRDEPW